MSISLTQRNYVWQVALLTLISVIGSSIYFYAFPQHYFDGYTLIPVFFLIVGIASISIIDKCPRNNARRLSQIYLLMRISRMILSLLIMIIYCVIIGKENGCFLLLFVLNYLIYLVFDSWFFFHYERKTTNEKKEKV